MEEEQKEIQARFNKRHQAMLIMYEKRRQQRLKQLTEKDESDSEMFLISFNKEKRELLLLLTSLDDKVDKLEISSIFDKVSQKIQVLQKFVSDSASSLPSYDVRRAQEILSQLRNEINIKREELLPKKKFAFKSRHKLTGKTEKNSDINTVQVSSVSMEQTHGFSNCIGKTLDLMSEDCKGKYITLLNLQDCVINIYGNPSALRIKNVSNITLHCGPISRAIFINDCYESELHLACQQLRIHTTFNTKFHILVRSKAIIEDCENVGFGIYKWSYEGIGSDLLEAGLDRNVNNWQDVDDFNWLKIDEKSPNWYILKNCKE